jgi:hypothetical protein
LLVAVTVATFTTDDLLVVTLPRVPYSVEGWLVVVALADTVAVPVEVLV